ncbi:acetyl-CoA carboxylase biotin carboxyl carrier protein [Terriglobus saanensis]|uniref:Biotin carboxyl carrier protein of acetyl-CoA carboxylase n=1 Tax=Terriglobus saanensis (strain ATCC BAA-1853 / DSM 23119 / SP1PR4) TaxID=401053 RepID=E8V7D5_TERSS|nr:acetyl-CoA carboxylase biotin carboxyl carrier protein [Terriglobus saanensis]ADV82848.1 acetyl-CoA carboxylase, biotin carboxyl carrier protein [Terriglobus saanensis SP1PR4]
MEEKDLKELRELVAFLKENEIAEFDLHRDDVQVRIKFASALQPQIIHSAPQQFAATTGALPVASAPGAAAPVEEPAEVLHEVKSPIVGTFYESSAPGVAAFVKVGDQVEVGQVLCIVEAMKLMNEIESDVAGEIVKQVAQNGQPVEYGQPLYAVRAR